MGFETRVPIFSDCWHLNKPLPFSPAPVYELGFRGSRQPTLHSVTVPKSQYEKTYYLHKKAFLGRAGQTSQVSPITETSLGSLWWLVGGVRGRVPCTERGTQFARTKGGSTQDFLSAFPDVKQKRKRMG